LKHKKTLINEINNDLTQNNENKIITRKRLDTDKYSLQWISIIISWSKKN